jgi:hypothetical protein
MVRQMNSKTARPELEEDLVEDVCLNVPRKGRRGFGLRRVAL